MWRGNACDRGRSRRAAQHALIEAHSVLSSVADALWASGPHQPRSRNTSYMKAVEPSSSGSAKVTDGRPILGCCACRRDDRLDRDPRRATEIHTLVENPEAPTLILELMEGPGAGSKAEEEEQRRDIALPCTSHTANKIRNEAVMPFVMVECRCVVDLLNVMRRRHHRPKAQVAGQHHRTSSHGISYLQGHHPPNSRVHRTWGHGCAQKARRPERRRSVKAGFLLHRGSMGR